MLIIPNITFLYYVILFYIIRYAYYTFISDINISRNSKDYINTKYVFIYVLKCKYLLIINNKIKKLFSYQCFLFILYLLPIYN